MTHLYPPDTVYFMAYAKLPSNIAAAKLMDVVGVGLIINYKTGIIEDITCTLLTEEAKRFLGSVIIGFNVHEDPLSDLIERINFRFHGLSQKAICVATKAAYERYVVWTEENFK